MKSYFDRVAGGESVESVLQDMIVNITPPGPGKSKGNADKPKRAKQSDSNKHTDKPGEPGDGATSQTGGI